MGGIINIVLAATLTAGPAGLSDTTGLQGPVVRITEGYFVEDAQDEMIQYFEQGADLPPNAERLAILSRSSRAGHMARVLSSADNDLRFVAERPEAFDIVVPEYEGQTFEGVVAVIDDDDGFPLAFVTSERTDILAIVVDMPGEGTAVIESEPGSAMPIDIDQQDMVIGVITPNPRGGFNALMDEVIPVEVQSLLDIYRSGDWVPGQN